MRKSKRSFRQDCVLAWLSLLSIMAAACEASGHPATRDGGSAGDARSSDLMAEVLDFSLRNLGINDGGVRFRRGDAEARSQAAFLDRDFGSRIFVRNEKSLATAHVAKTGNGPDIGVTIVYFKSCKQLTQALAVVRKAGRSNFKLEILTVFRAFPRDNALVFVTSETPFHPSVQALLNTVEIQTPGRRECSEP